MKKTYVLAAAGLTTAMLTGLIARPVSASVPKGGITTFVQNQTALGASEDANDSNNAVGATSGDVLKYTITVRNDAQADPSGANDMVKSSITDTLPAGLSLLSDSAVRQITTDLGTLKPGDSMVKEYLIKVTSSSDGQDIENKVCFNGNSSDNDNPQQGCDVADIKVHVPATPTPPTPTPTPPATPNPPASTPSSPSSPTTTPASGAANNANLPSTGPTNVILPAILFSGCMYMFYLTRQRSLQR